MCMYVLIFLHHWISGRVCIIATPCRYCTEQWLCHTWYTLDWACPPPEEREWVTMATSKQTCTYTYRTEKDDGDHSVHQTQTHRHTYICTYLEGCALWADVSKSNNVAEVHSDKRKVFSCHCLSLLQLVGHLSAGQKRVLVVKRREQLREKHKGPTYVTKTSIWYNHSYALVHHTPSHRVPCACPPTLAAGGIAVSQSCPSPLPDKGFAPEWSPQDWTHTSPSAPTGGLLCCLACYCAVCAHVQTYVRTYTKHIQWKTCVSLVSQTLHPQEEGLASFTQLLHESNV